MHAWTALPNYYIYILICGHARVHVCVLCCFANSSEPLNAPANSDIFRCTRTRQRLRMDTNYTHMCAEWRRSLKLKRTACSIVVQTRQINEREPTTPNWAPSIIRIRATQRCILNYGIWLALCDLWTYAIMCVLSQYKNTVINTIPWNQNVQICCIFIIWIIIKSTTACSVLAYLKLLCIRDCRVSW